MHEVSGYAKYRIDCLRTTGADHASATAKRQRGRLQGLSEGSGMVEPGMPGTMQARSSTGSLTAAAKRTPHRDDWTCR